MTINNIADAIIKFNKIGISFHVSPDGDALGSALALLQGLKKLNKFCYIMSKDKVPDNLTFLPASEEISGSSYSLLKNTDCVIVLDCGNVERISADLHIGIRQYTLINIDHHVSNDSYGDINYVDANSAAVGEIVYQLLDSLNVKIDRDISTCLYTSLITDTGSFRYSNTTTTTHNIAGSLINTCTNFSEIHRNVFDNKKLQRIKLYGMVIDTISLYKNGQICIMEITKEMLKKLGLENADTADVITFGIQIDSVEVAALLKETDDGIKISLRSKNIVDVSKVAENFRGGGHSRAAGLLIDTNLKDAEQIIVKTLEKELIQ